MIYVITGMLGAGKSLLAVQRAIDYASEGRRIATNFNINFDAISKNPKSKLSASFITVLPSIPSSRDLLSLGVGGKFEDTAGALILDECAQFLNSRQWGDKDRDSIIKWLLHARKRRWDVFLIIQHESMLDKQIRQSLCEYIVEVKRTDRMKIPFLPFKIPRLHIGVVRYGLDRNSHIADRWFTRGSEPMLCYDTTEIFDYEESYSYCTIPSGIINHWYSKPVIKNLLIEVIKLLPKIVFYYFIKLISPSSIQVLNSDTKKLQTISNPHRLQLPARI